MKKEIIFRCGRGTGFLARVAVLIVVLAVVVIAGDSDVFSSAGNEHWVGTWTTALHQPDLLAPGLANPGFNNQTLRQVVHASIGGHQVRVRLSTFGANSLRIGARILVHMRKGR